MEHPKLGSKEKRISRTNILLQAIDIRVHKTRGSFKSFKTHYKIGIRITCIIYHLFEKIDVYFKGKMSFAECHFVVELLQCCLLKLLASTMSRE